MPDYSKQIVYLSQAQYQELITNGTITVDGVTVTYNENDIYVTPQAEPVTDVRVAGTSMTTNGVANIPYAELPSGISAGNFGVVALKAGRGIAQNVNDHSLYLAYPSENQLKKGNETFIPVTTSFQHNAAFYGLAKAAGADMKDIASTTVGTYPDEQKAAIQQMLGVSSLIAPSEPTLVASKAYAVGDVFTANGKLYKVTTAIAAAETIVVQNEGEEVSGHNAVETSLSDGFVKFTDYATSNKAGVVSISGNRGIAIDSTGNTFITGATTNDIKPAANTYKPIVPSTQHISTFYGLAKAAGDTTQAVSDLPVGTYTADAKTAIRKMIASFGISDIRDGLSVTETLDTGEIIITADVQDVQVNGTSVVSGGIAMIPIASNSNFGLVKTKVSGGTSVDSVDNTLIISKASSTFVKAGANSYTPIVPYNQHESTFYGLAKAAGDITQAQSNNAVGTYTDEAKAAIRTMLGTVGTEDYASLTDAGVIKVGSNGITLNSSGVLMPQIAIESDIKTGTTTTKLQVPANQHISTFYGLAKASGDATQSASSNAVGTYTDSAKASIKSMLGIIDGSTGTVDVTGTTPTITAVENTRYVCGEVATLTITPPASGICIIRFTSGTTATVLTATGVVWPEWFDAMALEAERVYEICITDGYGAVMSWAQ